MPPSFVVELGALLLLGGNAALFVCGRNSHAMARCRAPAPKPANSVERRDDLDRDRDRVARVRRLEWGGRPLHLAVAGGAACRGRRRLLPRVHTSAEAVVPLLNTGAFNRSWPAVVIRNGPAYFIGASVAAGLVEIVGREMWDMCPLTRC